MYRDYSNSQSVAPCSVIGSSFRSECTAMFIATFVVQVRVYIHVHRHIRHSGQGIQPCSSPQSLIQNTLCIVCVGLH